MIRILKERCRERIPADKDVSDPGSGRGVKAEEGVELVTETIIASRRVSPVESIEHCDGKDDAAAVETELSRSDVGTVKNIGVVNLEHNVPVVLADHDILLGRGRTIQERIPNMYFRKVVSRYRSRYDIAKRLEKRALIQCIIGFLQGEGYRFLKRIGHDVGKGIRNDTEKDLLKCRWVLASHAEIYDKVSHHLRSTRRSNFAGKDSNKRAAKRDIASDSCSSPPFSSKRSFVRTSTCGRVSTNRMNLVSQDGLSEDATIGVAAKHQVSPVYPARRTPATLVRNEDLHRRDGEYDVNTDTDGTSAWRC